MMVLLVPTGGKGFAVAVCPRQNRGPAHPPKIHGRRVIACKDSVQDPILALTYAARVGGSLIDLDDPLVVQVRRGVRDAVLTRLDAGRAGLPTGVAWTSPAEKSLLLAAFARVVASSD